MGPRTFPGEALFQSREALFGLPPLDPDIMGRCQMAETQESFDGGDFLSQLTGDDGLSLSSEAALPRVNGRHGRHQESQTDDGSNGDAEQPSPPPPGSVPDPADALQGLRRRRPPGRVPLQETIQELTDVPGDGSRQRPPFPRPRLLEEVLRSLGVQGGGSGHELLEEETEGEEVGSLRHRLAPGPLPGSCSGECREDGRSE